MAAYTEGVDSSLNNTQNRPRGLTFRAVLLGLSIVVIGNMAAVYSRYFLGGPWLADRALSLAAVFPLFFLVAVVNVLLKSMRREFALRSSELAIIFMMTLVGSAIPTYAMIGRLFSVISAPYYFASPENQWAEYLHKYMPNWIVPNDENALRWFYEGLPIGEKIPWGAWIAPLFWWLSLLAVMMFVAFCIVALLRKQWVENERLIFPLMEIPLAIIEEPDRKHLLPESMRKKIFWAGFAVSVVAMSWNMIGYFAPQFPQIFVAQSLPIGRDFPSIYFEVFLPMIAVAFLVRQDISFSLWFFYLFFILQTGVFNRIGLSIKGSDLHSQPWSSVSWQSTGALIMLVLYGLWSARGHLKVVFRRAFGKEQNTDESAELLSSKTAVFGILFGMTYMAMWLHKAGMGLGVALVLLSAAWLLFYGLTRIVITGGLMQIYLPVTAQSLTVRLLGSLVISPLSMTSLSLSYSAFAYKGSAFMQAAAHIAKLTSQVKVRKKEIVPAVALAVLAGVGASTWYTLKVAYEHGAYNFNTNLFTGEGRVSFDYAISMIRNPVSPDPQRLLLLGIGGVVMIVLILLSHSFIWWPLHPVGYAISCLGAIGAFAFSIFVGWATAFVIIRLGGHILYRRVRPFFYGLLLGFFVIATISFIVDMIWFPSQGHAVIW